MLFVPRERAANTRVLKIEGLVCFVQMSDNAESPTDKTTYYNLFFSKIK
jgi:hypothetical protein